MGVDIFKGFTFGGKYSKNYGVYITGEAVFNAPSRDVEMISIPGRNGNLALDNGRFNNIEVTYPAGLFAKTESEFAEAISDFRNFLCSQRGYVRLEDDYNPNEYRMAVYKSGLEVSHKRLKAGEFDIVFECKPQRWLKAGETAVAINSGDKISNPTLFESSPLLEVEGYGSIDFNGSHISIDNALMGDVVVASAEENTSGDPIVQTLDTNLFNSGDTLTIQPFNPQVRYRKKSTVTAFALGARNNCTASVSGDYVTVTLYPDPYSFGTNGNASFYITGSVAVSYFIGSTQSATVLDVKIYVQYNHTNGTITYTNERVSDEGWTAMPKKMSSAEVIADSSVSILGNPTYIDCDLGEVYKDEGGSMVSLNRHIDLGSKLPTLAVGKTEITFDNTITSLEVVPRWWKI